MPTPACFLKKSARGVTFVITGVVVLFLLLSSLPFKVSAKSPDEVTPVQKKIPSRETEPEMVVIPAGSFQMGDLRNEEGALDEQPVHTKKISRFAMGVYEVSVGEFRRFVADTAYKTDAERGDGSSVYDDDTGEWVIETGINWRFDYEGKKAAENFPVIHVSWRDVKAYVKWLSDKTGETYRLPTEAELEYANRAGSVTKYPWGDGNPPDKVANLRGEKDRSPKGRTWGENSFIGYGDGFWGPAPVGSFEKNAFGLYDTAGNVWEWAEDCWHSSYNNAPLHGSAWGKEDDGDCSRRILRGGSWDNTPDDLRSSIRFGYYSDGRHFLNSGFRLAKTLK